MAAPGMRLSIKGLGDLQKRLRSLEPRVARKVITQSLREGAKIVAAEARRLVPVDTGQLKKSIKVRTGKARKGRKSVIVMTGNQNLFKGQQFYAGFVEYGHRVGKASSGARARQR